MTIGLYRTKLEEIFHYAQDDNNLGVPQSTLLPAPEQGHFFRVRFFELQTKIDYSTSNSIRRTPADTDFSLRMMNLPI